MRLRAMIRALALAALILGPASNAALAQYPVEYYQNALLQASVGFPSTDPSYRTVTADISLSPKQAYAFYFRVHWGEDSGPFFADYEIQKLEVVMTWPGSSDAPTWGWIPEWDPYPHTLASSLSPGMRTESIEFLTPLPRRTVSSWRYLGSSLFYTVDPGTPVSYAARVTLSWPDRPELGTVELSQPAAAQAQVVPEPGTLAGLAAMLGGLSVVRRRLT